MPKLTKRLVDAQKPTPERDYLVWDSELRGFGLRVWPSGKQTYILQYRNAQNRSRRMTIGQHGPLTVDQARRKAIQLLSDVTEGSDPIEERHSHHSSPTIADLCDRYMTEHAEPKKKPRSVKSDRQLWRTHVLPKLGKRKVGDITRADIADLHAKVGRKAPGAANRVVALLSKAFNLAEIWGWRQDGSNPCRHIKRFKERKLERFLSREELSRLLSTLQETEEMEMEKPAVTDAIRLLMYTGCRVGEILELEWAHVDLEQRCLNLPDSKTGKKTVLLSAPAVQVLQGAIRLPDNRYVIPGKNTGAHLVNIKDPWGRIRARAGIEDVRLHDLRHTFASIGVAAGFSLPMIGKSLGHQNVATTARYAHLQHDPVRMLVEAVGAEILAAQGASS